MKIQLTIQAECEADRIPAIDADTSERSHEHGITELVITEIEAAALTLAGETEELEIRTLKLLAEGPNGWLELIKS